MSRNETAPAVKADTAPSMQEMSAQEASAAPSRAAGDEGMGSSAGKVKRSAPGKGRGRISRARTIVLLVVFLSIVVGLIAGNGWGTLSSMGVGAIAYLCPLGALETLVAGHSPVLRTILALLCVLAVVALIGRAFCAWVCPVPPLRHFFRPNADKKDGEKAAADSSDPSFAGTDLGQSSAMTKVAPLTAEESATLAAGCGGASGKGHSCASCSSCGLPPVGGKRDGLQLDSRHGVLIGALASSAVFGFPVFCLICPVGLTIAVVVGVYRALFQQDPTVSLLIFAAILLVEVVFFRKWCHKICPIGALMSLVGAKAPLLRPRVATDKCLREQGVDCRACVKACPEQLDPHSASIPECSKCGLCAEACPVGAITFRKRKAAPVGSPVSDGCSADGEGRGIAGKKSPDENCDIDTAEPVFAEDLDLEESPMA